MLLLFLGCLIDRAAYEARLAELTDDDGDGVSEVEGDCDDAEVDVGPEAAERCNERDDDCDGGVDETDGLAGADWYADADHDGVGGGEAIVTCAPASGLVSVGGDCDDTDAARLPGAPERCNGLDDDCDGAVDDPGEVETLSWYGDADGDGYGDGAAIASCPDPGGASLEAGDCADDDPARHPAATETCNGVDDDCNGAVDDAPAITWYLDRDEDGFGDDDDTYVVCTPPPGYARYGGDCDDLDAARSPGAWDECEDGVDADCDGLDVPCGLPAGEADVDDVSARFTGDLGEAYVARTVASAGDLDGDGDDELVIARGGWSDFTGKVHLVPGDPELMLGEIALDAVGTVLEGTQAYGAFGFALGTGADVDGDGTDDVAVASYGPDSVALFRGGASLLTSDHDADDAWATYRSDAGTGTFGISLALLGDLDGDGFGEVVIGDDWADGTGAAYLFYGDGVGGAYSARDAVVLASWRDAAQGGQEVARVADLDGDGLDELAVAENIITDSGEENHLFLFLGDGGRLASTALHTATVTLSAAGGDGVFAEVAGVGDLNRDGYGELATSAPERDSDDGVVLVVLGRRDMPSASDVDTLADFIWKGTAGDSFGAAFAGVGDTDSDGYVELVATGSRSGGTSARASVVSGAADFGGSALDTSGSMRLTGANSEAEGEGVAGSVDLNGDGAADLLVSAWVPAAGQGEAWLLYGAP